MNSTNLQKRALATREAHMALLDLKKFVDEATQTTHTAELEAVSLAISPRQGGDTLNTLRVVIERLQSPNFEAALSQARDKLETAVAWQVEDQ
jgi:hypothetical protein